MNLKTPKNRSDRIRQSARMEDCTVRSAQCNFNPETTIYAHLPLDGGIATKPDESEETIVNAEQNHVHTQLCEAASALHKAETATKDESIKQKCYEVGLHVARLIRDFDGTTSHA